MSKTKFESPVPMFRTAQHLKMYGNSSRYQMKYNLKRILFLTIVQYTLLYQRINKFTKLVV